jgi:hypothetical protein
MHQNVFMFIGTEFSKLSIKPYKLVGEALKLTIETLNCHFTQKKIFKIFFFRSEFFSKNSAPSVYFHALIKLLV